MNGHCMLFGAQGGARRWVSPSFLLGDVLAVVPSAASWPAGVYAAACKTHCELVLCLWKHLVREEARGQVHFQALRPLNTSL